MPVTYSGEEVDAIEATDKLRSSGDPSFIPANMPMIKAPGTITIITQNIRIPV
jgi:small neutral amino acid transporter SnatA (MarC family)